MVIKSFPSELAFGQLMRTLAQHGPGRIGHLRRLGKQTRALAAKPTQAKRR